MKPVRERFYVPVFANWEGDIAAPSKFGNGTIGFYAPGFPPVDQWPVPTDVQLNATVPAFWMAIEATTPVIYKNNYFVVLGEHNIIVDGRVSGEATKTIANTVSKPASSSLFSKVPSLYWGSFYSVLALGAILYVARRIR
jgi:hypothetical protein